MVHDIHNCGVKGGRDLVYRFSGPVFWTIISARFSLW